MVDTNGTRQTSTMLGSIGAAGISQTDSIGNYTIGSGPFKVQITDQFDYFSFTTPDKAAYQLTINTPTTSFTGDVGVELTNDQRFVLGDVYIDSSSGSASLDFTSYFENSNYTLNIYRYLFDSLPSQKTKVDYSFTIKPINYFPGSILVYDLKGTYSQSESINLSQLYINDRDGWNDVKTVTMNLFNTTGSKLISSNSFTQWDGGSTWAKASVQLPLQDLAPGKYTVRFSASDGKGFSDDLEREIEILQAVSTTNSGNQNTDSGGSTGGSGVGNKPTDISLNNATIAENQPIGTTIGTLSTTDPNDPGKTGTYTYSLAPVTGSTDSTAFEIVGNQLKAKQSFNFEAKNSYSIKVRTTDSTGLTFDKDLKISVSDLAEPLPPPPVVSVFTPKQPNPTDEPIVGDRKNNRLPGTAQDDLIRGIQGDDKLNGKGGNDILVGGAGNDLLRGGAGDDVFRGGQGNDTFVLNGGFDRIQAFSDGQDQLKLVGGLSFANLTITQQGSDTLVRSGGTAIVLLTGVNSGLITAADFV